jgi:hypothetical protein
MSSIRSQNIDSSAARFDTLHVTPKVVSVYAGLGVSLGGRVGIIIHPLDKLTIEGTYGYGAENFLGLSEVRNMYSIGFNWFYMPDMDRSRKLINAAFIYAKEPVSGTKYLSVSSNLGLLFTSKSNLFVILRGGLQVTNRIYVSKKSMLYLSPNIDLGIGIGLF